MQDTPCQKVIHNKNIPLHLKVNPLQIEVEVNYLKQNGVWLVKVDLIPRQYSLNVLFTNCTHGNVTQFNQNM